MTLSEDFLRSYGAVWDESNTRIHHYGRPNREQLAVRNGVGITLHPYDLLRITGDDRIEFVDNVVTNAVAETAGSGVYALLLNPDGSIRFDLSIYTTADQLMIALPAGIGADVASTWSEKIFIQDVEIHEVSTDYTIFGVYGPDSPRKVQRVASLSTLPSTPWAFSQSRIGDTGVTIIRTDNPLGEPGFHVVCDAAGAEELFTALITDGEQAIPFGTQTWEALTLEAGTPIYPHDLEGNLPNEIGCRSGLDFDKGCFVGQEIVSRIENRGRPPRRLVGVSAENPFNSSDTVYEGSTDIGHITRASWSEAAAATIGFALIEYSIDADTLTVESADGRIPVSVHPFPFVAGSTRSKRIPQF